MTPENNNLENDVVDTTTPSAPVTDIKEDGTEDIKELTIEELRAQYRLVFGKDVSNAKKNDAEWIKSKLALDPEENEDTTPSAPVTGGKVKIKLITDVFYKWDKLKEGTELTLDSDELVKFADSFYEKV